MPQQINATLLSFNDETKVHCIVVQPGDEHREHAVHEYAGAFYYTQATGSVLNEPDFIEEEVATLHQAYAHLLRNLDIPL